jgi:hypothetical protein
MNIWDQPDHVRITAAEQRLTERLALCPADKNESAAAAIQLRRDAFLFGRPAVRENIVAFRWRPG